MGEHLQVECSQKDRQFGFPVDPCSQIKGHDIEGKPAEWIPRPEEPHMFCPQKCSECFLVKTEEVVKKKIHQLTKLDGIPPADITVVVSMSDAARTHFDNDIKTFFKDINPDVKTCFNFEME